MDYTLLGIARLAPYFYVGPVERWALTALFLTFLVDILTVWGGSTVWHRLLEAMYFLEASTWSEPSETKIPGTLATLASANSALLFGTLEGLCQ